MKTIMVENGYLGIPIAEINDGITDIANGDLINIRNELYHVIMIMDEAINKSYVRFILVESLNKKI